MAVSRSTSCCSSFSSGQRNPLYYWTRISAFIVLGFIRSTVLGEKHGLANTQVSDISTACGDVPVQLRAPNGIITSPGWPFNYPTGTNCSWYIQGNREEIITISFQEFDIQTSAWCSSDWLTIGTRKSIEGIRVCGSSIPAPFISSKGHVWIEFHSDDRYTGKGFRLSYVIGRSAEASCNWDQFHCNNGKCILDIWKCNSMDECGDNSDEEFCELSMPPTDFPFQPCTYDQFQCLSRYTASYTCLPESLRCDGNIDCLDLEDEIDCDVPSCGEWLRNFYGTFNSPNYPAFYPPGSNCTWLIDTGDRRKVILRINDLKLDGIGYGDYIKVYDGLEENSHKLLRVLTPFDSRTPITVISSSGQVRIHFHADKVNAARGFNATYQVEGFCLPWEIPCGGNWGCYFEQQRCDGYWHCPNGRDEHNCSSCQKDEFPCSRSGVCYPLADRCNYQNHCPNGSDEKNCFFCQPGNFHCKNNRCVFESWVCDAQDDCGDGSDEENCPVIIPTRVITAAVIGSLICGLLLVIALGCTCKLYSLRMFERRSFETHLSRVEAELLRREAPPSYGQLIAQGLIPPVEDFPVCSSSQASILENLRLAVRSQLGLTSIRSSASSSRSNLWNRIFSFTRSRNSGSLALVSTDRDDPTGEQNVTRESESLHRRLMTFESDDADRDSERRDIPGAVGGLVVPLPQKVAPTAAVEVVVGASGISSGYHINTAAEVPTSQLETSEQPSISPARQQLTSALSRVTQSLRWMRFSIGRSSSSRQNQSPLRQLDTRVSGREDDDDDDVELLIPISDPASDIDMRGCCRPVGEPSPRSVQGIRQHSALMPDREQSSSRDGPCEHCGIVHTAQVPNACLEATLKNEASDDESLLVC
ncbi:low-density lipoprotein receptor-related protein 12 isoform X1 [Mobula birostris]|uniref:low-density lipoprotein receptor-related protein 12 isoform X1 n=1 Tax=Mobula birostris TaxID=1983395 RepID=UPI003B28B4FE